MAKRSRGKSRAYCGRDKCRVDTITVEGEVYADSKTMQTLPTPAKCPGCGRPLSRVGPIMATMDKL